MTIERFLSEVALRRRSIGAFLIVAVFFLPFHFHAAAAASSNISHECSCLNGTRTVIGAGAVAAHAVSQVVFALPESFQAQLLSQLVAEFQSIRAPPAF